MRLSFSLIIILYFFASCTYSKKEIDYPIVNATCDTADAKFSTAVLPIFSNKCNSCHGGNGSLGGGIVLDNYADVKDYLDNNGNKLLNSINQNGASQSMPKNGSKLSDCNVSKITAWINAGAINN